jgi:hypothetical protein
VVLSTIKKEEVTFIQLQAPPNLSQIPHSQPRSPLSLAILHTSMDLFATIFSVIFAVPESESEPAPSMPIDADEPNSSTSGIGGCVVA